VREVQELRARYRQHWTMALARNYLEDDADGLASALAFGAIFSLMPILVVTFFVLTLLLKTEVVYKIASSLIADDAPSSVTNVVGNLLHTGEENAADLGIMTLITFLLGGGRLYTAMERACAQVFRTERRPRARRRVFSVVMMPLIPLLLLATTIVAGLGTAALTLPLEDLVDVQVSTGGALAVYGSAFLLAFGMLLLAYWRIPVDGPSLGDSASAAAVAAALTVLLAQVFPIYIKITGGYNPYGSVFAFVLVLLLWLYLEGQIFVIGAEIAAYRRADGPRRRNVVREDESR